MSTWHDMLDALTVIWQGVPEIMLELEAESEPE